MQTSTTLIQIKIKLDRIKPDIWRRFIVDSTITLHELHEIIQIVMGWWNYHLYDFTIGGLRYSVPSDDDIIYGTKIIDTSTITLADLKLQQKKQFRYTYDFGDNWEHIILIEKIITLNDQQTLPLCLEGKRNCPPEDCGSVPGYNDLIEAMKNKRSKEAKELISWLGKPYNPEFFDIKEINEMLKSIKPPKKKSKRVQLKLIPSNNN